jgi:hypothetical protein
VDASPPGYPATVGLRESEELPTRVKGALPCLPPACPDDPTTRAWGPRLPRLPDGFPVVIGKFLALRYYALRYKEL